MRVYSKPCLKHVATQHRALLSTHVPISGSVKLEIASATRSSCKLFCMPKKMVIILLSESVEEAKR